MVGMPLVAPGFPYMVEAEEEKRRRRDPPPPPPTPVGEPLPYSPEHLADFPQKKNRDSDTLQVHISEDSIFISVGKTKNS